GSTECFGPIRGETLDMQGMETMTERVADYFVGHHPTMPGSGKTAHAVDTARCLEDSAHASMMTSVTRPGKTPAAASSNGLPSCLRAILPRLTRARADSPAGLFTNCRRSGRSAGFLAVCVSYTLRFSSYLRVLYSRHRKASPSDVGHSRFVRTAASGETTRPVGKLRGLRIGRSTANSLA